MKTNTRWNTGMRFTGNCGGNEITLDAKPPLGQSAGMTPKELVVVGLSGCTAMDVIALLKKHKQEVTSFNVEAEVEKSTGGHPEVFSRATLTFKAEGPIDPDRYLEAVDLSQNRYCGVSAMLSKAFPIEYRVILNGSEIGSGTAFQARV